MEPVNWYGNWHVALAAILVFSFIFFAFVFKPKRLDWRKSGLTEAFVISLFTEMFGFPLTIYIVSWLLKVEIIPSALTGHLWATLLAIYGILDLKTGVIIVMFVSVVLIALGIFLLISGWVYLYKHRHSLTTKGPYALVRHPQYLGILLVITGFIIQWPTILTLFMYPILVYLYYNQAANEEANMLRKYGKIYADYMLKVPRFNILLGAWRKLSS